VEAAIGRKAVSSKHTNNFFISTSVSEIFTTLKSVPELRGYSRLLVQALSNSHINRIESFEYIGQLLASLARKAQIARRMDVVEQASQLMLALPLSEPLKGIALFHRATCIASQGDLENARFLFEQVAERSTPQYRARALHCIGATYYKRGNIDEALPFYLSAGRASINCDLLTEVESQWMIAVVRSIHGDHKQTLGDLEKLFPLVRAVSKYYPALYYDYLNSLSVEFGEIGRIAEAESAISIALSSSFAPAYPEWSETREEIEQKRNYPDLSRCFIDRSLTESEAIPDSNANLSVEADTERVTAVKPVRASKLCRFVGQTIYQRPVTLPNAVKAIIPGGLAQSFLQRLGRCIQPRAPPTI
jgi:tetratricopeptide (TPR) repeat protein